MTSRNRLFRRVYIPLLTVAVAVPLAVAAAPSAAPTPGFTTTTINGGITAGGQLAVDSQRRAVFVADGDSWSKKIGGRVWPVPRPLNPKIAVLNADTRRVTRTIDYLPLPAGSMNAYGVKTPSPQVPAGVALDTRRGLIVTTNAQSNGAAIVPMNARAARPSDIVQSDGPLAHPMGHRRPAHRACLYRGLQPQPRRRHRSRHAQAGRADTRPVQGIGARDRRPAPPPLHRER